MHQDQRAQNNADLDPKHWQDFFVVATAQDIIWTLICRADYSRFPRDSFYMEIPAPDSTAFLTTGQAQSSFRQGCLDPERPAHWSLRALLQPQNCSVLCKTVTPNSFKSQRRHSFFSNYIWNKEECGEWERLEFTYFIQIKLSSF